MRVGLKIAIVLGLLSLAAPAVAKPSLPLLPTNLRLAEPEPWALSARGHGGAGLLATSSDSRSHGGGGAELGLRVSYLTLAGHFDHVDYVTETSRTVGGLAGTLLPFAGWVDIEAALGAGQRTYRSGDPRFGTRGLEVKVPTLLFRLGISDSAGGPVGVRFGGGLAASVDLARRGAPWTYGVTDATPEGVTGVRDIGGVTFGLFLQLGLEYLPTAAPRTGATLLAHR
jgi:hypothetical protein